MPTTTTLRLLIVTPRFLPLLGGVENHVNEVARRLAATGAEVTVLTADVAGNLAPREEMYGVQVERVPAWPRGRDYYFAPDVYQRIAGGDWDLVHVQSYHTLIAPMAMHAALRSGIPYIVTFHGGGHSSWLRNAIRRPQWLLLRPLLARAARLVATARFEVGLYGKHLRIPAERFMYIPNGSDLPPAPEGVLAPQDNLILSVGRLERYKGHHRAITALPHVLAQRPDTRLRIVGAGPDEARLRVIIKRLGLQDRVEIGGVPLGDRQAMSKLLASAALVTLLSDYETHPMAALEALSLGRPLLVADSSGLSELAQDGLAQAVSLNSNPQQVAAAMLRQLQAPLIPGRITLSSWDDCSRQLLGLYQEITGVACAS